MERKERLFISGTYVLGRFGTDRTRVDDLLAQEAVLAGVAVEEAPVHLHVPPIGVQRTDDGRYDPQVKERVVLFIRI